MMRVPDPHAKTDTRFVWYWLQALLFLNRIERNAKGTSPTMKKFSQGTVMAITVPNASLEKQHRIVTEFEDLSSKVDCLKGLRQRTAAELDALFPSILDTAFKGEL